MATSPRPYQQSARKNKNTQDLTKRPRDMVKKKAKRMSNKKRIEKIKLWTTFYRLNVHRFAQHYLGLSLYPFQLIMLFLLNISNGFMCVASRGTSKTFILAVFACCRAILYPKSQIVVVALTKDQAGIIVTKKIQGELMKSSANLCREIKKITANKSEYTVEFHNGSTLFVVPATDSARGNRSNFTIYEEFRLIPKKIIDEVIAPMAISRQPNFLKNPKYKQYTEEYLEAYISSAWYKNHEYMWDLIKIYTNNMLKGGDMNILAFDYLLSIHHGLKTEKQIKKDRAKTDEISFMMEYENIMFGENKDAFFKLDMFKKNQCIKKPFYPLRAEEFAMNKTKHKNPNYIKKVEGEIRIISCDIAVMAGDDNDNTVFTCMRLLPTKKGYHREVIYLESMNGVDPYNQALRIQQLFNDFEANYIVLDGQSIGVAIYTELGKIIKDEERGVEYMAYTSYQDIERFRKLTMSQNAMPIIYIIQGNKDLNSTIATLMRTTLEREMISFLVNIDTGTGYLSEKNKDYMTALSNADYDSKIFFEHPYLQTQQLINECVNLKFKVNGGLIKLEESRSARKDRYSSLSYGNYFASILEADLLKEKTNNDFSDYMFF